VPRCRHLSWPLPTQHRPSHDEQDAGGQRGHQDGDADQRGGAVTDVRGEPPPGGRSQDEHSELAGEPFVTTRPGYWQRALTDRLFTDAVIVCEGDEPYAIRGLISAGVGIGLMPAMARRLAPDPPVGWLHLDVPSRRTLSLVWRAGAYRPAAARALTEFAAGYFRSWRGDA
jgi:DNA-binding transcriptional LysR family regulator